MKDTHGYGKTNVIEKKLRSNVGKNEILSVYFLYYVVYSFHHV